VVNRIVYYTVRRSTKVAAERQERNAIPAGLSVDKKMRF
jgi:hypothetical protein